ncbi:MAG: YdeI/OmpD-associated family protein [Marinoscillum sp.]
MKFKSHLQKFSEANSGVYSLHIPVDKEIADRFINGTNRRVKCTINHQTTIFSGLMPFTAYWYILINQELQKKLGINIGDEVDIELEKDNSEYGMEMPEELQVLLAQDPLGNEYFHDLTPGKQRNLIYIVSKVKNSDSRLSKALAIVDHLVEMNGQLNFKLLNVKLKEYNNRGKLK